ncbi:hypothetical protein [Streptomyces sp. NPDC059564]|uniref:hypothetical protein n=1 Tax=Streptomyces sp. NPDC059564 TaxID=3346865 RepID=UPI00369ABE94
MEGPDFPYKPAATDTFHVIEGEAELVTPDGEKIEIIAGGIYSSRRVHGHLENPVAVHEVFRRGLGAGTVRSVTQASAGRP